MAELTKSHGLGSGGRQGELRLRLRRNVFFFFFLEVVLGLGGFEALGFLRFRVFVWGFGALGRPCFFGVLGL